MVPPRLRKTLKCGLKTLAPNEVVFPHVSIKSYIASAIEMLFRIYTWTDVTYEVEMALQFDRSCDGIYIFINNQKEKILLIENEQKKKQI